MFDRQLLSTLSFSLALSLGSSCAFAEKLSIGVDAWPPFRHVTESSVSGIDDDLWHLLSRRMGFEIDYVRCPWKRCLKMMELGQIDAMSGLAWREERARYITYTQPEYYRCTTRFYVRKGEQNTILRHNDLHSLVVGMVRGSAYYRRFDQDKEVFKQIVKQEAVLPTLLLEHRIDTYIGTDCQADYELKLRNLSGDVVKARFEPGNSVDLFIGLSSRSRWAEKREEFNRQLKTLQNEGFQQQIIERYYSY